ncbi:MAG: PPA1309 family protein [Marmoricola sp.]
MTEPSPEQPQDQNAPSIKALRAAVREVEQHASRSGWDRTPQLFALVDTAELLQREPNLAELLGVESVAAGELTPVEQDPVDGDLEDLLAEILWPPEVLGCAVVVERLALPPGEDGTVPTETAAAAAEHVAAHPDREEIRIVAGVLRGGAAYCALRVRSHDEDSSVIVGDDLVPALLELLHATLEPDAGDPDHE